MGAFVKGEVVVVPFPFSDLSATKRRPSLVVAQLTGDDVIRVKTADSNIILYSAGAVTNPKMQEVTDKIIEIVSQ